MSRDPNARKSRWLGVLTPVLIVAVSYGIVEAGLAVAGVRPLADHEDPYVGFTSYFPLFVDGVNDQGVAVKKTAKNKLKYFNPQQFLAEKPKDGYRIFCLGGSTTYGHPYDDGTSFAGWLRASLPEADPTRHWEVVNCGGISYASYRLALLMEELCEYQPNLFIVYTGHNEFLERRTYQGIMDTPTITRRVDSALAHSRVYTVIERFVNSSPAHASGPLLPAEVDTILDNSVGPTAYHRDDTYSDRWWHVISSST